MSAFPQPHNISDIVRTSGKLYQPVRLQLSPTPFNMRYILPTLASMALASSCVTALGINCQGSSKCDRFNNPIPSLSAAESLRREIAAHVSDSRWYQNGQQIVCIDLPA